MNMIWFIVAIKNQVQPSTIHNSQEIYNINGNNCQI